MSKKILIIDDLPLMRVVLKRVLQRQGYEILEAANGQEGIKLVIENENSLPDLIICDIMMPVMDGYTFLQLLKQKFGGTIPMPVMVLSAKESKDDVLKAVKLGAKDYIVKPFENNELLAKINKYL